MARSRSNPTPFATLISLILAAHPAIGQTSPQPMGNALERSSLDLSGPWRAIVDPWDAGSVDYKSRPRTEGYWTDRTPESPLDAVEYDFDTADTLMVPGDWNTQSERLFHYEGIVWYRKKFDFSPGSEARQFVRIGAANRRSTVWLNGQHLGDHPVGFTPGIHEATHAFRNGENTLVIRVDNRRDPAGVPALLTDWWNYGGITRRVDILECPTVFVRDVHAELSPGRGMVRGWIVLDGPAISDRRVRIRLGAQTIETRTGQDGSAEWNAGAKGLGLWSPENPALHTLRVELLDDQGDVLDTLTDRIGLRTITTDGGRLLLNGEPIRLRGICAHEVQITGDGRAWSETHARELAGELKKLGCNFVRLAHYPHAEIVSRVMDEAGILVWAEVPVYWTLEYDNPETLGLAKTHIRGLIGRDHNRASVIIWSIGNETGSGESTTTFRRALAEEVRSLDGSRLLAAALEPTLTFEDGRVTDLVLDDPFGAEVDVLAINSYTGWYVGLIEDLETLPVSLAWDKPFMVSEFGAGAKRGLRPDDPGQKWTEAYQARLFAATLDWLESTPNFVGCAPWILSDFRSPRRPLAGVQDWWNRKGVLDEQGQPKEAYRTLRDVYAQWRRDVPDP